MARGEQRWGWGGPPLMAFVVGTAIQLRMPETLGPWPAWALIIAGLAALGLSAWHAGRVRPASRGVTVGFWVGAMSLAGAFFLGYGAVDLRAQALERQALDPALEGKDLELVGVVAAMPQRQEAGLRFRFEVESARSQGREVDVPKSVWLGWYGPTGPQAPEAQGAGLADLRAGERWRLGVRLKAPHGQMNPHGFDYELWLWEQGLRATGTVRAGPGDAQPLRLDTGWRRPIERLRQAARDAILARGGDSGMDQEPDHESRRAYRVIAALVTGDQSAIERTDWDRFRATGVAHLMSISGLHITLFAWLAGVWIDRVWRGLARRGLLDGRAWPAPSMALVGGLLLAGSYALFAGWGIPAQRTVLMLAVFGGLRSSGRDWPWWAVWLLACALVVALDPWALLQAGFWLSFVAVGVLFSTGDPSPPVGSAPAWTTRLWARVLALGREQGRIGLALAPLSLLLFGQVSVVGLLANLVAIPWVTLVVTPLALGGLIVPVLWSGAAAALAPLAWLLDGLAAWPGAQWWAPAMPVPVAALALFGALMLARPGPWTWRLLGLPLLWPVLAWPSQRPSIGEFDWLAADVGQGNAVVLTTRHHALLYDTGPRYSRETDAGHRTLVPLLRAKALRIDRVILSHRDSDHSGGARAVQAMQPQADFWGSEAEPDLAHAIAARGLRWQRCEAGQSWVWDGVRFEMLHPWAADYASPARPNARSCVLRVVSASGRVALLVGDIEAAQEQRLVAVLGAALRADLLLVPHHGSRTSSTAAFIDAVRPRIALVQAGYRNRFGHPVEAVVHRYGERGIRVLDSPSCGSMAWSSVDPERWQCARQEERRIWRHHPLEATVAKRKTEK